MLSDQKVRPHIQVLSDTQYIILIIFKLLVLGPVCYRNNGFLTVTDANLCLGRILPKYFPKIFGPQKNQPLDKDSTIHSFNQLTQEINEFINNSDSYDKKPLTLEEVAMGFIRVANESMCRPIRAITQGKGYDTSKHILACFGGAGNTLI